jgi:small-conductance mechanosensitive channel
MIDTIMEYLRMTLVELRGTKVTTLTLLTAIVIVLVTKIISMIIARSIDRVLEARGLDRGLRFATTKITRYVILVVGIFVAVGTLGIDTGAIMASGAVLLVGIGFGLQRLADNFISGLLVLIERPIKKGDFIDAGGVLGTVEDIGLRATLVTSRDGVQVILPNSNLMSSTVINYSAPSPERRFQIPVGVAYGTDLDFVCKVMTDVARAEPKVLETPAPEVRHMGFGDNAIELVLLVWIADAKEDLIVGSKLRFALDRAFRQHKISIPFPQRDVHIIDRASA